MTRDEKILRSERKEATREQILIAATKLLAQHGYAALRVAAVAQEAGISLGGYLHHFASKESLVVAVLERLSTRVLDVAKQDAAQDTGKEDVLLLIANSAQRFYSTPEFLIYLDIFLSTRRHTFVGDTAITLAASQRTAIEALWLPHLTARGIDGDDAILVIRALWGLARGLAISSSREDVKTGSSATMTLVIAAIRSSHFRDSVSHKGGEQTRGLAGDDKNATKVSRLRRPDKRHASRAPRSRKN
ncbi:TetR/AcrR family transcriptional regulator [Paraburkholderia phenoliruptrix]|uniref:TetR/AcrR family transcriptional regulator n=1 Tax=Paraburkholderia phenoliruptrix TaxID=252970 RepID=UPI001C6E264B|nr:TetR/AcrR family transcriptional regulator [Paraburkholderia phenoliruptrix]MBW9105068.1 TetR/AcrR family transcriptional regulator [Paraburkholderia phenoliruptrix]MBW9129714.1 TetR/AcrR family transcriptional regulator [Paraburkholderia ginsengiterrae]